MTRPDLALLAGIVLAHGSYPIECCSDRDCAPYDGPVTEVPGGWQAGDDFIPKALGRASFDGRYHLCRLPGGRILCWFVPLSG